MAEHARPQTQAQRLADALSERGLSIREFGKQLAGPKATLPQQEAMRRQVQKWLGGQRMLPKSARNVAAALSEPVELWLAPTRARDEAEQISALELRVAELEDLVAQLRDERLGPEAKPDAPDSSAGDRPG